MRPDAVERLDGLLAQLIAVQMERRAIGRALTDTPLADEDAVQLLSARLHICNEFLADLVLELNRRMHR